MPLGAMAQTSLCCFSTGQCIGSTISTERQPSSTATWQVLSTDHFAPAALKHQKTIDCLIRPLTEALPGGSAASTQAADRDTAVTAPTERRNRCLRLRRLACSFLLCFMESVS